MMNSIRLTRRTALSLGGGAAITLSSLRAAPAPDLDDARIMFRKLQYRTDSGPLFWWIQGPYFADIDATLTPLFAINMGVIQRIAQREDGGFDVEQIELSFRTDIDSGKRLTEFHNPLTNETVPVGFSAIGPSLLHFAQNNLRDNGPNLVGSTVESTTYPPKRIVKGEDVFFTQRSRAHVATPGAPDRVFNDYLTLTGSLKQLRDPRVRSADAKLQSTDVSTWQRWMKMGERPGSMTLRALGGKVHKFADMPADWLAMAHEAAPDVAADPIGALKRPPAEFKN